MILVFTECASPLQPTSVVVLNDCGPWWDTVAVQAPCTRLARRECLHGQVPGSIATSSSHIPWFYFTQSSVSEMESKNLNVKHMRDLVGLAKNLHSF